LPIPNTGRERNILLDSGDLIQILLDNEVDIILNGHKHVPNVWMIEKMVVINAGTATTFKLRGETLPSYNKLLIDDDKITVNLVHTEDNETIKVAEYYVKKDDSEFVISNCKKYIVNHHIH
jgi:predicted phosphodiesterase